MISIILPAYNEEETIAEVIDAIHARLRLDDGETFEIVVVDDGSLDATPRLLDAIAERYPAVRVLHHAQNQGLGKALKTGFQAAAGRLLVTMDADMTHPPELISELVRACDTDFVVASRFVPGGGMHGVPWWRVAISQVGNLIFRALFRTNLRDITAGYKIYRTALVRDLPFQAAGFEVQLEITIRLLKQGATFREIPYILGTRTGGVSKMVYLRVISKYLRLMGTLVRLPRTTRPAEMVESIR